MNRNIDDEEMDEMIMRAPSAREKKTAEHDLMFKALSNPIRRKLISAIGVFGSSVSDVSKKIGIDQQKLDYHLDFLVKGKYVVLEGDTYRLTDQGLALLSNI